MEWEIVTVIIALVGLLATVTKPIMKLTNTITKLNDTILWMHATIWDTLGKNQKLKEENLQLKAALNESV